MKLTPTLDGGFRIDTEHDGDWVLLHSILDDADPEKLAHQLSESIQSSEIDEDWREFVVPDLIESFNSDLAKVREALKCAHDGNNPQPIHVPPRESMAWYSSLNQARLNLEECFHFDSDISSKDDDIVRKMAFLRSKIYLELQSLIFERAMNTLNA